MDGYGDADEVCPHCGHSPIRWEDCSVIGCEDGFIDMHEHDDPLWYSPGEEEMCLECQGTGIVKWCPNCGRDPREKRADQ